MKEMKYPSCKLFERGDKRWVSKFLSGIFKRYTTYNKCSLCQHLIFLEPASPGVYPLSNVQNHQVPGILDFQVGAISEIVPVLMLKETAMQEYCTPYSCNKATGLFSGIRHGFTFTSEWGESV